VSDADEVTFIKADQAEIFRLELLAEGLEEVAAQSRRYVREPSEAAWYELVRALSNVFGDADAYELLRATEIHSGVRRRSTESER
jgi:hypothetical protein